MARLQHTHVFERQDGGKARQAMRKHLLNSLGRVRALAKASGIEATEAEQKAAAASLFKDLKRPLPTAG